MYLMKEVVYKFIKTQAKATQSVIFDALAYRSVYGELPEGLSEKHIDILNLIIAFEYKEDARKSERSEEEGVAQSPQYKRGAPKGNRNNIWCQKKDAESTNETIKSTNEVQKSTNESTNQVQISTIPSTNNTKESTKEYNPSTNGVQFEYNSSTNTDTKEKESEKENASPSQTLPLSKEKDKEKENVCASLADKDENKDIPKQEDLPPEVPLTVELPKPVRSVGTFVISSDELKDKGKFHTRFPFVEEGYVEAFMKWLTYKKERQQTYKSVTSLRTCYNKLVQCCNNSPDVSMEVVDTSIANNWAGLFEYQERGRPKKFQTVVMQNLSDPNRGNTEYGW